MSRLSSRPRPFRARRCQVAASASWQYVEGALKDRQCAVGGEGNPGLQGDAAFGLSIIA